MQQIKPGSVILSKGKAKWWKHPILAYAYWRIKRYQKKLFPNNSDVWEYTHVKLILYEVPYIKMNREGSSRISYLNDYLIFEFAPPVAKFSILHMDVVKDDIYIIPEATDKDNLIEFSLFNNCVDYNGSWYDVGELLAIDSKTSKFDWGSRYKVCSTGVDEILKNSGYDMFEDYNDKYITPAHFAMEFIKSEEK